MQQVDFDQVAALDLAKHLDKRIETVLSDFMDRCCECGVTYEDATAKAITILAHYFIRAALGIDATEAEVLAATKWNYGKAIENGRSTTTTAAGNAGPAKRRRVSE